MRNLGQGRARRLEKPDLGQGSSLSCHSSAIAPDFSLHPANCAPITRQRFGPLRCRCVGRDALHKIVTRIDIHAAFGVGQAVLLRSLGVSQTMALPSRRCGKEEGGGRRVYQPMKKSRL